MQDLLTGPMLLGPSLSMLQLLTSLHLERKITDQNIREVVLYDTHNTIEVISNLTRRQDLQVWCMINDIPYKLSTLCNLQSLSSLRVQGEIDEWPQLIVQPFFRNCRAPNRLWLKGIDVTPEADWMGIK